MATRAREGGSVREVFLLVALGLFMIGYGGRGVGAEVEPSFLVITFYFAVAAGAGFLLAAFFGARTALRQRRRR